MAFSDRAILLAATGFNLGRMPIAPGTFGTLLGLPLYFLLSGAGGGFMLSFTALFIVVAIWVSDQAEKLLEKRDPGCIVIDEIAGLLVTFVGIEFSAMTALCGFVVFRGFDIVKPFPIGYLEKRIRGGTGVVVDDVLAGLFGNLVIRVFFWIQLATG